jgi:hypothetical protein
MLTLEGPFWCIQAWGRCGSPLRQRLTSFWPSIAHSWVIKQPSLNLIWFVIATGVWRLYMPPLPSCVKSWNSLHLSVPCWRVFANLRKWYRFAFAVTVFSFFSVWMLPLCHVAQFLVCSECFVSDCNNKSVPSEDIVLPSWLKEAGHSVLLPTWESLNLFSARSTWIYLEKWVMNSLSFLCKGIRLWMRTYVLWLLFLNGNILAGRRNSEVTWSENLKRLLSSSGQRRQQHANLVIHTFLLVGHRIHRPDLLIPRSLSTSLTTNFVFWKKNQEKTGAMHARCLLALWCESGGEPKHLHSSSGVFSTEVPCSPHADDLGFALKR